VLGGVGASGLGGGDWRVPTAEWWWGLGRGKRVKLLGNSRLKWKNRQRDDDFPLFF
jgi:hypothetical protein